MSNEPMATVRVIRQGDMTIASVRGEVDISNIDDVQKDLEAAAGSEGLFVVDLSETTYFDSAGIRLLFTLASRVGLSRRRLQVVVPEDGIIRRLLELTGLAKLADLRTSTDAIHG